MMLLPILMFINLNSTALPYNTTLPANPADFTRIITQNIPWFFPLLILITFIWVDYVLGTKSDMTGSQSFVVVGVLYTFFSYLLVAGGLTTSGMFYLFMIIGLMALFFDTLITSGFP